MGESQNSKTTTLVMVGKTGNGKSATGNSILGRIEFESKIGQSVTKKCKLASTVLKDGRKLNVVDTPGLFDTQTPQEITSKEIVQCIELAKDGLHGILLVTSVRTRFTEEEAAIFYCLEILFGPKISDYMVVVFTGGDELESEEMTFSEYLANVPNTLQKLLGRCKNRTVLFNNKTKSQTKKTTQVAELLMKIDYVVAENQGKPYSKQTLLEFEALKATWSPPVHENKELTQIIAKLLEKMEKAIEELSKQLASERDARIKAAKEVAILTKEVDDLKNTETDCWGRKIKR